MADFKTHVTTSTVLGIGYAGAGIFMGAPLDTSLVAGGLCGVSGMLPDIDSGSGRPLRETMAFAAVVVPMLLLDRFRHMGMSHEMIVLAGGILYLFIRFGIASMLRRYTVHRGMFHSIPAAIVFTELAFLIVGCETLMPRYYKAGGVFIGFMSHLLLDELYSVQWQGGRVKLKKSFGSAIKFWGDDIWGNVSVYAKLIVATGLVLSEPLVMEQFGAPVHESVLRTAQEFFEHVHIRR